MHSDGISFDVFFGFLCALGVDATEENRKEILKIIHSPASFYREFRIPKRRGGSRVIQSPYPTLAFLQRKILDDVISKIPVHDACYSFVPGRSIVDHAKNHLNRSELLTLDIKDFFPSITEGMLFDVLCYHGVETAVSYYLSKILTLNNQLPQGAPTSPYISNIVFFNMDRRIEKYSMAIGVSYSRYADDLAFSGAKIPRGLSRYIDGILNEYGFFLNKDKTKLKIKGSRKIITGVSVSGTEPKVPRSYRRAVRAQIHQLEMAGGDISGLESLDPLIHERLLGKINHWLHVEPNNSYVRNKKEKIMQLYDLFIG